MYNKIKQRLDTYDLPTDPQSRQVADTAVDCALEYVLDYAQGMSEQLVKDGKYSEAMVAGILTLKIKRLLGE